MLALLCLDRTHEKDPQAPLVEPLTAPRAKGQTEHTEKAITLVLEEKITVCAEQQVLGDLSTTLAEDQLLGNNYST